MKSIVEFLDGAIVFWIDGYITVLHLKSRSHNGSKKLRRLQNITKKGSKGRILIRFLKTGSKSSFSCTEKDQLFPKWEN